MRKGKTVLSAVFALTALTAVYAEEEKATTTKGQAAWTPSRMEHYFGGEDPIGGYNRVCFAITDGAIQYVAKPISTVWTTILPRPVIKVIDNMCNNLLFPERVLTCLGSAEWKGAGDECVRFLANTTIGIGGMFDPAKHWFHFYDTKSDSSRMFGAWGIKPGCTFMFPLTTIVTPRDAAGAILDYCLDGRSYVPYSSWTYVNLVVCKEKIYSSYMAHSVDRYHAFRLGLLANRELINDMAEYRAANQAYEEQKVIEAKYKEHPELLQPSAPEPAMEPVAGVKNMIHIPWYHSQGPYLDTVRSLFFRPQKDDDFWYMRRSLFNSDFVKKADEIDLKVNPADDKTASIPCLFWKAEYDEDKQPLTEENKELVVIIPGIGSHYDTSTAAAMAEIIHNSGRNAAVVSSAFTPEFMSSFGQNMLPGYTPRDCRNVRTMLEQLWLHLNEEKLIPAGTQVTLMGWSFGGLHTLHIAAMEKEYKDSPLQFRRYLSLNTPVDMAYAMQWTDKAAEVSKKWTVEEARAQVLDIVGKVYFASDAKPLPPHDGSYIPEDMTPYRLELTEDQCRYIISLSFSGHVRNVLLSSMLNAPDAEKDERLAPCNRMALLEELDDVTLGAYAKNYLMPQLGSTDFKTLTDNAGLRSLESALRQNDKIRVVHNADDILLNGEADRAWLTDVFGDNMTWFDHGGHLGSLYTTTVQNKLLELLK